MSLFTKNNCGFGAISHHELLSNLLFSSFLSFSSLIFTPFPLFFSFSLFFQHRMKKTFFLYVCFWGIWLCYIYHFIVFVVLYLVSPFVKNKIVFLFCFVFFSFRFFLVYFLMNFSIDEIRGKQCGIFRENTLMIKSWKKKRRKS